MQVWGQGCRTQAWTRAAGSQESERLPPPGKLSTSARPPSGCVRPVDTRLLHRSALSDFSISVHQMCLSLLLDPEGRARLHLLLHPQRLAWRAADRAGPWQPLRREKRRAPHGESTAGRARARSPDPQGPGRGPRVHGPPLRVAKASCHPMVPPAPRPRVKQAPFKACSLPHGAHVLRTEIIQMP